MKGDERGNSRLSAQVGERTRGKQVRILPHAITYNLRFWRICQGHFSTKLKQFFEIEHSTDIYNSLLKFVEFQDFRTNFYIVADGQRRTEFESKILQSAFTPVRPHVKFWDYDSVVDLHAKATANNLAEQALL